MHNKSTVPDFLMTVTDFSEVRTIIQYERWHCYISVNQTDWFKSQIMKQTAFI